MPGTSSTGGVRLRAGAGPLPWLGALLALYLVVPIVALAGRVGTLGGAFGAPGLLGALWVSLATASVSTLVCALLGVPLGWSLARSRGRLGAVAGAVVQVPLAVPPLMSGLLLVAVVGPHTAIGSLFGGRLTDTTAAIVLAQTFVASPFTVVAARSAFAAVDPVLLDVAATLGWDERQRFRRVALPLAAPGIGAGLLLTWLRAFGEFGATVVLAFHPTSLPVFGYVQFAGGGVRAALAPTVLALAVALVALALLRLSRRPGGSVALRFMAGRHRPEGVEGATAPRPAPAVRPATPARVSFAVDHRLGKFRVELCYRAASAHVALLGPSGAGKTAVLRCLAGLDGRSTTRLSVGTTVLSGVAAEERGVGYVPQEPALVPGLTVWEQVTAGRHVEPAEATRWIEVLGLGELAGRRPHELSGGQRQRTALARALANRPRLLLLDEPLTALDVPTRLALGRELRRLLRTTGLPTVVVTHDPAEAARLADDVVVLDAGRLLQAGSCTEVLSRPASPAVAGLLGVENRGTAVLDAAGSLWMGALAVPVGTPTTPGPVSWAMRARDIEVGPASGRGPRGSAALPGTVVDVAGTTDDAEVTVALRGGPELVGRTLAPGLLRQGERCDVDLAADRLMLWPRSHAGTSRQAAPHAPGEDSPVGAGTASGYG